jgi:signal peptidase II
LINRRKVLGFLAVVAAVLVVDRIGKQLATKYLVGGESHSYLADTVRLEFTRNAGAILGLGSQLPEGLRNWLLPVLTAAVLILVLVLLVREPGFGLGAAGLSLAWGGGFANFIDRLVYGEVVDFFNLGIGEVRTGISNLADVAIMVGIPLILIGWWLAERTHHGEQEGQPPATQPQGPPAAPPDGGSKV